MLTIRRRGSAGKWYIRGTVTLDDRFIEVREFCTGTTNEDAARHVMLERERSLIEAYVPHVRPIATMFAFQGPRTQEALQLTWGAGGVDLARGTIFFARTKTGNPRSVAIHPRVEALLGPLWEKHGRPDSGHVFLNRRGHS